MILAWCLALNPPLPESYLDRYCVGCHADEDAEAGLDIEALVKRNDALGDESSWIHILERIRRRDMPPEDHRRQPEESAAAEAEASIRAWLPAATRLPHVPLRRMTRDAWTQAVDELLSVQFPSESFFPADDIGEGFNRTASLLRMSPLLTEKYMEAAEQVATMALDINPARRFPSKSAQGVNLKSERGTRRLGGILLSNRGEVKTSFHVERRGRYMVQAKVAGQQAGLEPVKFIVRAGSSRSEPLPVASPLSEPTIIQYTTQLNAGPIEIGAAFINDFFDKGAPKPNDRNALVLELVLVGPLDRPLPDHFLNKIPTSRNLNSLRKVLRDLVQRAFRGNTYSDDVDRLLSLSDPEDTWNDRMQAALVGVLMSPRFLLVAEGSSDTPRQIEDQELATKLASFLWNGLPDDSLLREVEKGTLSQRDVLQRTVKRMLKDPRSRSIAENFGLQWLHLDVLAKHRPDPDRFPNIDTKIRQAMQQETVHFLDHILRRDLPVDELIRANYTFVDSALAEHYGFRPVPSGKFRRVRTPNESFGLLRHASILMATSNPTRTSPVKRGKWVLTSLLDAPPPPAPPGVDGLTADGQVEGMSLREQMEMHRANPDCASCHIRMDALGFALEGFDAVGRAKTGTDIDDLAELPDGTVFRGASGLRDVLLADLQPFRRSLARHLLVYATQRGTGPSDDALLDALSKDPITLPQMIEKIVLSDAFLRQGVDRVDLGSKP